MRYRKLTADGDYTFGGGQNDFYRDVPEAPAQAAKTRLMLWLGEWFIDDTEGTPYLQGVIGKHEEITRENVLRSRVLGTQGITEIVSYESLTDADTRKLNVSVEVNTLYGVTTIQAVI